MIHLTNNYLESMNKKNMEPIMMICSDMISYN